MARSRRSIPGLTPPTRPARRGKRLLVVSTVSALSVYFFDPQEGTRRRHVARDRALALFRRGGRQAASQARYAGGRAAGTAHELSEKVAPDRTTAEPMNDQTLIRKVESEIFRDPDVPKADITVDAAGGTVWLRGQARTPEMIKELLRRTEGIPEVLRAENLLHLPGTPSPTRTDSPEGVREGSLFPNAGERSVATFGVTAEEPVAEAEPPPDEKAVGGEGRTPAPLGSEGPAGGEAPPDSGTGPEREQS